MNYSIECEKIILKEQGKGKRLLLHSCCAPCSSYVLQYLRNVFQITVFYYNPNITDVTEYQKRVAEQKRLIEQMNEETQTSFRISFVEGEYRPEEFLDRSKGLEKVPEGGVRCHQCFALRLGKTAQLAKKEEYDYFTTTLSISPLKDANFLNQLGMQFAEQYDVAYLLSDFKKKDGYKQSIELSRKYNLYRQNYCGCEFSKQENQNGGKDAEVSGTVVRTFGNGI